MPLFRIPTEDLLWGPAPIDWCEPNRPEINPWGIQEFHNTWSNVAYVVVGIVNAFALTSGRKSGPKDPLLYCFCFFAIMTGIASAWFHATLLYAGQKSDEFFENAMVLGLLYSHLFPVVDGDGKDRKESFSDARYILFWLHVVLLGVGVFCIPEAFCEVHLVGAVLASSYAVWQRSLTIKNPVDRHLSIVNNYRSLMWAALGFASWIVDVGFCSPLIQQLHLHAFAWHWLTAVALHVAFSGTTSLNHALQQQLRSKQP